MLITMLTAMYMMVKVVESIGVRFAREEDPLPYMVSQPLPWQVHSVSHSRRSSKAEEFEGLRRNSIGVYRKNSNASNGTAHAVPPLSPVEVEKAAATIQTHFRKFQQKKQKNGK
ncbi:Hypothetical protein SMAX5B_013345 [Scophthalmus maximus]|uniref:Uncharacterized protein n=1 Tax=Scophthalmus maximus TaxID=52904 RepID=A0A2U9B4W0_SCOMX|nr:uncharacterized protein LOC118299680 isoform X2 [Scophthalmus maximus]AWO98992.1 Hypothetical protein SMAX5B_013345 [Scophthalmus maximus]KAF0030428.1 hypothetical protein F2P81_017159 [Scophthalmus maximus]